MHGFSGFLLAVANHWVSLMSGIASVGIALWLRFRNKTDIDSTWFWGVGFVCLFLAFFFAWQDEFEKSVELDKKIAELSETQMDFVVDAINRFPLENQTVTGVLLVLRVTNRGSPSIVDNFTIRAAIGGK